MISASQVHAPNEAVGAQFDVLINCVGFETRSIYSLQRGIRARHVISLAFPLSDRFFYRKNLDYIRAINARVLYDYSADLRDGTLSSHLNNIGRNPLSVAVDITSMNRSMIAAVLVFLTLKRARVRSLTIIYAPREFSPPLEELPQIEQIGPVLPELNGFCVKPGYPTGLLISVGFEHGIAVGIINKLEPQMTVCLHGVGGDPRFEQAVLKANLGFDFGVGNTRIVRYDLQSPKAAYDYLENLVYGMTKQFRVVMIPLGPKLLAVIVTLLSLKFLGSVAYWRVGENRREVHDALPDGRLITAEVDLAKMIDIDAFKLLTRVSSVSA